MSSSAPLELTTPCCGCSILTTAPPWSPRGTSTRPACGKAVPDPATPYPALPAPWARPPTATILSLPSFTLPLSSAITLLKRRFYPWHRPQPADVLTMRAPPWTSRYAHRTPSRPVHTVPDPGLLPSSTTTTHTFHPSSDRIITYTPSVGVAVGRPLLSLLASSLRGSCSCPWLVRSPCACESQPEAVFLCLATPSLHTSHADQLRPLEVQLASLASLEEVVTHGIHSLLEPTLGPLRWTVPSLPRTHVPAPARAPPYPSPRSTLIDFCSANAALPLGSQVRLPLPRLSALASPALAPVHRLLFPFPGHRSPQAPPALLPPSLCPRLAASAGP